MCLTFVAKPISISYSFTISISSGWVVVATWGLVGGAVREAWAYLGGMRRVSGVEVTDDGWWQGGTLMRKKNHYV